MKRYIKPELFYERYEVSQHLADCAWEFQLATDPSSCKATPDPSSCKATPDPAKLPGLPAIFLDAGVGCELTDVTEYENYCYQTSAAGIKLHMS